MEVTTGTFRSLRIKREHIGEARGTWEAPHRQQL